MSRSHAAEAIPLPAPDARRVEPVGRRELGRAREVVGAMLASARDAAGQSGRAVAFALGVDEASLRRWEAGEVSAPLDALVRLPASVALNLGQLLCAHARGRLLTALPIVDIDLAVSEAYARWLLSRDNGPDARKFAMDELLRVGAEAQGRLAR